MRCLEGLEVARCFGADDPTICSHMAGGQNQWYHFGLGAPPILEPILVVGLGCSLGILTLGPHVVCQDACQRGASNPSSSMLAEGRGNQRLGMRFKLFAGAFEEATLRQPADGSIPTPQGSIPLEPHRTATSGRES